jgi:hypothetical protein
MTHPSQYREAMEKKASYPISSGSKIDEDDTNDG